MASRKKDTRTLKRTPQPITLQITQECGDEVEGGREEQQQHQLKKHKSSTEPSRKKVTPFIVVERIDDERQQNKPSSSNKTNSERNSERRRKQRGPSPGPSSSSENSSSDEEKDSDGEEDREVDVSGQSEAETDANSSNSETYEVTAKKRARELQKKRKEKLKKQQDHRSSSEKCRSSASKQSAKHKSSSKDSKHKEKRHRSPSSSSTARTQLHERVRPRPRTPTVPNTPIELQHQQRVLDDNMAMDTVLAVSKITSKPPEDDIDSNNIEKEILDYNDTSGPAVDQYENLAPEAQGDTDVVDSSGNPDCPDDETDGDDGDQTDGTDVLDESPPNAKSKMLDSKGEMPPSPPLQRQNCTIGSPSHTRSGLKLGTDSCRTNTAAGTTTVNVDVPRKKSPKKSSTPHVSAPSANIGVANNSRSSSHANNSARITHEDSSYDRYYKETYASHWERWCYAKLPGDRGLLLYDFSPDTEPPAGLVNMHVVEQNMKLNNYKRDMYTSAKTWIHVLMSSLHKLSQGGPEVDYRQVFSIMDLNDDRHMFYGRTMGSDSTIFSVFENVLNGVGLEDELEDHVSLYEFPQIIDLVRFEQDRHDTPKDRINKFAEDSNSEGLIAGILDYVSRSINVDKRVEKKKYDSTISYHDGLFVMPSKYQSYIFPNACELRSLDGILARLDASYSLTECDSLAIEILILLESLLMVHNVLYPVLNYDQKWTQLTFLCYKDLQALQEHKLRAPSSLDYQLNMMNLLDKVIDFEYSSRNHNSALRHDRGIKQAFYLLVDLCCMNRILTLSFSHEARCKRIENDNVMLLTRDRDMVVHSILVKFLDIESTIVQVDSQDTNLRNFLQQLSKTLGHKRSSGGTGGSSSSAKSIIVEYLKVNLPDYFKTIILNKFMSEN